MSTLYAPYADEKETSSRRFFLSKNSYNVTIVGKQRDQGLQWQTKKIKDFLRDEKLFYGRVDTNWNSVLLRKAALSNIGSSEGLLYVQNFVADAYNAMSARIINAMAAGQVQPGKSVFFPMVPQAGYVDPMVGYSAHVDRFSEDFVMKFLADPRKKEKIVDFDTFMPFFREYLKILASDFPMTISDYIISSLNTPLSSGLMVEIHKGSVNNDKMKSKLFYSNPKFPLFRDIAYQHGFMIDKHVPWRLVADIASPNMRPFLLRNHPVFPQPEGVMYFGRDRAYEEDIPALIRMAVSFYNMLATRFPFTQTSHCSEMKSVTRSLTTISAVESSTKYSFWLKVYAEVRNLETGIEYGEHAMEGILENANTLARKLDRTESLSYINSKFNSIEHLNGSLFYDLVRRAYANDPIAANSVDISEIVKGSVRISNFDTY